MTSARLSPIGRSLRAPWHWFWGAVTDTLYSGRAYTLSVPQGHRVYTPWFENKGGSEFGRILTKVAASGPTIVSADRCYMLFQFARKCLRVPAAMAECGVFTGGTAQLLAEAAVAGPTRPYLHLFDTFAGMPATSIPERDYHSPGDFAATSLEAVQRRLGEYSSHCRFHPGLIPHTFAEVADVSEFGFVHVDVDIYPASLACCEFFWPRLAAGGVMIFDDYGFLKFRAHAS